MPASLLMLVHVPLEQNCPAEHVTPQAPQLVGSIAVFTHAVIPSNGHAVRPGGHVMPESVTQEASAGSPNGAVDCDLPCVLLFPEHAASAIMLTMEPTANIAAHQRERTRNTNIFLSSPWEASERNVVDPPPG
jgi:hypothetical protein